MLCRAGLKEFADETSKLVGRKIRHSWSTTAAAEPTPSKAKPPSTSVEDTDDNKKRGNAAAACIRDQKDVSKLLKQRGFEVGFKVWPKDHSKREVGDAGGLKHFLIEEISQQAHGEGFVLLRSDMTSRKVSIETFVRDYTLCTAKAQKAIPHWGAATIKDNSLAAIDVQKGKMFNAMMYIHNEYEKAVPDQTEILLQPEVVRATDEIATGELVLVCIAPRIGHRAKADPVPKTAVDMGIFGDVGYHVPSCRLADKSEGAIVVPYWYIPVAREGEKPNMQTEKIVVNIEHATQLGRPSWDVVNVVCLRNTTPLKPGDRLCRAPHEVSGGGSAAVANPSAVASADTSGEKASAAASPNTSATKAPSPPIGDNGLRGAKRSDGGAGKPSSKREKRS